jgi:hypothetical protein
MNINKYIFVILLSSVPALAGLPYFNPIVDPTSTNFQDSLSITISPKEKYAMYVIYYTLDSIWKEYKGKPIVISQTVILKTYIAVECTGWCYSETLIEQYTKLNTSVKFGQRAISNPYYPAEDRIYSLSGRLIKGRIHSTGIYLQTNAIGRKRMRPVLLYR